MQQGLDGVRVFHTFFPLLGCPAGGEDMADVDVNWPDRPRPRIAGGLGEGRSLEPTRPGAATEAQRVPRWKARSSSRLEAIQPGTSSSPYFMSLSILLSYNLDFKSSIS